MSDTPTPPAHDNRATTPSASPASPAPPASPRPVFQFDGFESPQGTIVPDQAFDLLMPLLSGAQWKVLCYIMRRTFGFKKSSDNISLSQICHGIVTKSGKRLDSGTGLSKSTVVEALHGRKRRANGAAATPGLIELGIVRCKNNRSATRGDEATTFRLRFKGDAESVAGSHLRPRRETRRHALTATTPGAPVSENQTGGSPKNAHAPVRKSDTQTTVETTFFSKSSKKKIARKSEMKGTTGTRQDGQDEQDGQQKGSDAVVGVVPPLPRPSELATAHAGARPGFVRLDAALARNESWSDFLARKRAERKRRQRLDQDAPPATALTGPQNMAPHGAPGPLAAPQPAFPQSEASAPPAAHAGPPGSLTARIETTIDAISEEFGNGHLKKSNRTRVGKLLAISELNEERFLDRLYQARSLTREKQRLEGLRRPMAWFFTTLTDKLTPASTAGAGAAPRGSA